jgi:hypothetical protein
VWLTESEGGHNMNSENEIHGSEQQVQREIRNLVGASRKRLKETWRSLYCTEAPERMSDDHLKRSIAYRLQERAFGGLNLATRRLLERVADEATGYRRRGNRSITKVPAGTLLMREWHGKTHKVTVTENGVVYRDKRYRSLSEVAGRITGAHWSGPLFFGLKAAGAREKGNGTC